GTSRIQTVTKGTDPLFYELIREFYRLTKIPLILNTSLNRRGEPIVESPEDALKVFLGSEMDVLVLGNYLLTKRGKEEIEGIKGIARTERIVASALKFVRGKN
ncbi:MAG: hypothetical protein NTY64_15095, partial [Deltaproteobacteria bacterium]|nr:hypothetical protein [Deltaproteobacteria bacterium]